MGHTPPSHYLGRVMALCILIMHLKGRLSINLVVLFVILLLDVEHFLAPEEDVLVSVLSLPLEETLCSCPSDFLQRRSKEVSLCAEVCSLVGHPDEARHEWVDMFSFQEVISYFHG